MIKRMKWNVLHGGGGGEESDGGLSSSSDESDDDVAMRQSRANAALQQLVERDPELAEALDRKLNALGSSSEEDEGDAAVGGMNGRNRRSSKSTESDDDSEIDGSRCEGESGGDEGLEETPSKQHGDEDSETDYVEWRECNICPGKRFLNDQEVEGHLKSKKHLRAEARAAKEAEAAARAETSVLLEEGPSSNWNIKPSTNSSSEDPEALKKKQDKRKAAAKRKLKALKRRKWEKKTKAAKGASEVAVDDSPMTASHAVSAIGEEHRKDGNEATSTRKGVGETRTAPKEIGKRKGMIESAIAFESVPHTGEEPKPRVVALARNDRKQEKGALVKPSLTNSPSSTEPNLTLHDRKASARRDVDVPSTGAERERPVMGFALTEKVTVGKGKKKRRLSEGEASLSSGKTSKESISRVSADHTPTGQSAPLSSKKKRMKKGRRSSKDKAVTEIGVA